ncbi:hypothetical protein [Paenibacillus chitinolyticus]|uniref:hypothetical protein n=1 Tax=Paenibacillus chitinolyticus TaxID=79263 RepID=UPI00295EE4B7|nr:hypothetical protein [Paenibacillus chitinolyticus]
METILYVFFVYAVVPDEGARSSQRMADLAPATVASASGVRVPRSRRSLQPAARSRSGGSAIASGVLSPMLHHALNTHQGQPFLAG